MAYTFQDFEKAGYGERDRASFVWSAVTQHESSDLCRTARTADLYDRQLNVTINEYVKTLYTLTGGVVEDFTAGGSRIASNFFNRLNTQRVMYSLGNGISFLQPGEDGDADDVKGRMGPSFDHDVTEAAYHALIHGVSYLFWNLDRMHVFKATEFAPLWDEHTGELRAGIRYWRLGKDKPMSCVLYEEDGYTEYRQDGKGRSRLVAQGDKRAYRTTYAYVPADDKAEVIGEDNYGRLPIVPMWASRLKQSTLVGMRAAIDAYDLIKSGFADDLQQCAEIFWIVKNAPGMRDSDLVELRDRIKLLRIAAVDGIDGASVEPHTQEVPHQARESYLRALRDGIYEDFGALDVHAVAAGSTNDHIDAAYQPMDENAADFEFWVSKAITQVLALAGIDDQPEFRRNRISNQKEQVEMVALEAQWLDQQTVLRKLPNISAEEVPAIMDATAGEDMARFGIGEVELP